MFGIDGFFIAETIPFAVGIFFGLIRQISFLTVANKERVTQEADTITLLTGAKKTAYEMLSGDWSSDVCSSDLHEEGFP